MRAIFCDVSSDITLLLTKKEIADFKRTEDCSNVFEAKTKGYLFSLIGTQSQEYIKVREPTKGNENFWISISDSAYYDLVRNNECGTRFGNSYKIKICLDDEL